MKLELVRQEISRDTVEALEEILQDARAGLYTGFVIGLLRPRRRYSVHCIGEGCESPTWSRGILRALDDELKVLVDIENRGDTKF